MYLVSPYTLFVNILANCDIISTHKIICRLGSLIEYAAILFKKQKVSKYGVPSQSAYAERATAAMAIAAATQNAAAGAFTLGELLS